VRREQAIIMAVCQHYSVRVYETNNVEEITHSDHSEKKMAASPPCFGTLHLPLHCYRYRYRRRDRTRRFGTACRTGEHLIAVSVPLSLVATTRYRPRPKGRWSIPVCRCEPGEILTSGIRYIRLCKLDIIQSDKTVCPVPWTHYSIACSRPAHRTTNAALYCEAGRETRRCSFPQIPYAPNPK
jgi:hypothetical protein